MSPMFNNGILEYLFWTVVIFGAFYIEEWIMTILSPVYRPRTNIKRAPYFLGPFSKGGFIAWIFRGITVPAFGACIKFLSHYEMFSNGKLDKIFFLGELFCLGIIPIMITIRVDK